MWPKAVWQGLPLLRLQRRIKEISKADEHRFIFFLLYLFICFLKHRSVAYGGH